MKQNFNTSWVNILSVSLVCLNNGKQFKTSKDSRLSTTMIYVCKVRTMSSPCTYLYFCTIYSFLSKCKCCLLFCNLSSLSFISLTNLTASSTFFTLISSSFSRLFRICGTADSSRVSYGASLATSFPWGYTDNVLRSAKIPFTKAGFTTLIFLYLNFAPQPRILHGVFSSLLTGTSTRESSLPKTGISYIHVNV